MTTFSQRLKEMRERRRLDQQEVAEYAKISRYTLSQYERGKSAPGLDVLIKLSEALSCSVDYLVGKSNYGELSEEENTLVGMFRKLDPGKRLSVFDMVHGLELICTQNNNEYQKSRGLIEISR